MAQAAVAKRPARWSAAHVVSGAMDGAGNQGARSLFVVRVKDVITSALTGHEGCEYRSPPQSCEEALALARLLLGHSEHALDGGSRWKAVRLPVGGARSRSSPPAPDVRRAPVMSRRDGATPPAARWPRGTRPQLQVKRARLAAAGSLIVVAAVALVIVLSTTGGSGPGRQTERATSSNAVGTNTTNSGSVTAPILAYHVINQPPPQSALSPRLYVPAEQFTAQMQALKAAGWHAVTLDQLEANWTRGASLGSGKPIVISFDNGYASQYTNALPVLKQLGWVGVENLQVNGLSPSDGGLSDAQVRGLIGSGWELDAGGVSQTRPDRRGLLAAEQRGCRRAADAPRPLQRSGELVLLPVRSLRPHGGRGGSPSRISRRDDEHPGMGHPASRPFRLPRLQVVAGTSPSQLLSQITAARQTTVAPTTSTT